MTPALASLAFAASIACAAPPAPAPEATPPAAEPAPPTSEAPMWMTSARTATIGKKQLDALIARIAALPDADQRRLHAALDALDAMAVDVDGLDQARRTAEETLPTFAAPDASSGLPPAAKTYRDGALAVLQARSRMIGAAIAERNATAEATRLIGACGERTLGREAYDLKVEASIGLGALAPAALRGE